MDTRSASDELCLYDRPEEWLNKLLNRDGCFKDLASLLDFENPVPGKTIGSSGTRELDYPSMRFHAGGELEIHKSFSLPPELIEKFAGMQSNCLMGIFTSCNRAWVTIDNELFMWNYEDGDDLAYYDGIKDTIICVGLAQPRVGVLPDRIQHLLCIATALELFVLGVTYSTAAGAPIDTHGDVLHVLPDPLYCLPTDNYTVTCMECTTDGRMFLGTQEGSLLELNYSPIPGWTGDPSVPLSRTGPCTLINHSASAISLLLPAVLTTGFRTTDAICQLVSDPTRHLLYLRTENSNLAVYSYSIKATAGTSLTRLAQLSSSDLAYTASGVVRSVDKAQFRSIASVLPLFGGPFHLMAVTKTGIRLYFGEQLRLLHIRLPPTSPYGRLGLGEVKLVTETRGTVVLISALPPNAASAGTARPLLTNTSDTQPFVPVPPMTLSSPIPSGSLTGGGPDTSTRSSYDVPPNILYTLSPDPYPWTPNLTEVCTTAWCVGGVWALTVLPSDEPGCLDFASSSQCSPSRSTTSPSPRGQPPVVLTQHLDPPYRRLLLISAQGLVHLRLPSPIVRLKEFLLREVSSRLLNPGVNLFPEQPQLLTPGSFMKQTPSVMYPSFGDLDDVSPELLLNTGFLSAYLHQFSPDEAICAALIIGSAHSSLGESDNRGLGVAVEQAVLFFAAEAAQFWVPAVRRPNPGSSALIRQSTLTGSQGTNQPIDRALFSGMFLFSGITVFLARMARTFWRSPLFRDASAVSNGTLAKSNQSNGLIGSWMRSFVNVLASASPLRGGRSTTEEKRPVISRLDPNEITWLIHQLSYLQRFLQRQLKLRGGWLRASTAGLTSRPEKSAAGDEGSDQVDGILLQRLSEELDKLVGAILEILEFWRIFSEHAVHRIAENLTSDQRTLLLQVPFESYALCLLDPNQSTGQPLLIQKEFTAPASPTTPSHPSFGANVGLDMISALINALIEYYLTESGRDVDSGISLDVITTRLRSNCPTLFANEDAISAKASECLIQAILLRSTLPTVEAESPVDASVDDTLSRIDELIANAQELYAEAGPGLDLDGAVTRLEACGAWHGAVALCLAVANKRDPNDVAADCLKTGRRPSADPIAVDGKRGVVEPRNRRQMYAQSELSATEGRYDAYHHAVRCFERLWVLCQLPPSATDLLNQSSFTDIKQADKLGTLSGACLLEVTPSSSSARILLYSIFQEVVQSTDILAHFEVFSWLISHGLTDTAVALNSPHLEAYLRSRLRQCPDDPDLRCLLWRQLERRGARLEAAQVLEHLAVTPCRKLTLEARLDFAARAIVTVRALPIAQQDMDYLHDLESRLELGQLQHQLCVELSQLLDSRRGACSPGRTRSPLRPVTDGELQEAIFQLSHGPLLSLSEMFTDYADKFGIHECKLVLLWAGDSQDAALINAIWRDLLRSILNTAGSASAYIPGTKLSSPLRTVDSEARRRNVDSSHKLVELAIVDCLARLGNRFSVDGSLSSIKSQTFFPLGEILSTLEYYAIQQKLACTWVPTILRDTRLTCSSSITEAYDTLLHSKNTLWRHSDVRNRLFSAFVTVIEDFLNVVSIQLPARQRMLQIGRILDRVTSNLVDLNSTSTKESKDTQTPRVIERLRHVHDQLQRFYR
ncbi:hypothetical protein CRM22_010114 [Opisthorchis felineus]|uniref:Uncharacterized protein n=1 Tax=Opisthorchis felineus TaxID=147828 RepID=A0A4S2L372_OPIFE|nr:hypothetical protein CRM22_010114 [Opisthorchis felineus]